MATTDAAKTAMPEPAPERTSTRMLLASLAFWVLFSGAMVWVRGVQWDEDYEFAQAMTRQVVFPEGHPLFQYTRSAYNLQFSASALQLWLCSNPLLFNGFRNILFVLSTVLPPFILTWLLTRRVLYAHLAVALTLTGIHLSFDGSYPQFVWPGMFSNGHIGVGYALILATLLAGGYWRSGALLFGLMPCIHLGQLPPFLLFVPLCLLLGVRKDGWPVLKQFALWTGVGLLFCVVYGVIQHHYVVPPPTDAPYAATGDVRSIWEGRITGMDIHRKIPVGNIHLVCAAFLLIGLATAWMNRQRREWVLLVAYGLSVLCVAYGIMCIHALVRHRIPYVMLGWIPYRLLNHIAPILIALCIATVANSERSIRRWAFPLLLLAALVVIRPGRLWNSPFYQHYVKDGAFIFFALWGMALGIALRKNHSRFWYALALLLLALLTLRHQFGFLCTALAACATFVVYGLGNPQKRDAVTSRWPTRVMAGLCVLLLTSIVARQWTARTEPLPRSRFDKEVAAWLAQQGDHDQMVVGPPFQLMLQARINQPVMTDAATPYHASYVPSLGPAVQNIFTKIHGISFEKDAPRTDWRKVWVNRSLKEWQALGNTFNFRYVIAPENMHLPLNAVIVSDYATLYTIPVQKTTNGPKYVAGLHPNAMKPEPNPPRTPSKGT